MEKRRVIVAGGGAAGLMAAISAAQAGASVTVLEVNEKPGKKLSVTGNGRCNLTNRRQEKACYRGEDPELAWKILQGFSVEETTAFFESIGICVTDKDGYLYPRSLQAASVVSLLEMRAQQLKVRIKTRERIRDVRRIEEGWQVLTEGWHYEGDAVILAMGSPASQVSGSSRDGLEIAKRLGHTVRKPLPALAPLRLSGGFFKAWDGVRTQGSVMLTADGKLLARESGELQLTDYGVSGIPVFQVSRFAARALEEGKKVQIHLNFMPEYTEEDVRRFLENRRKIFGAVKGAQLLIGVLPEKLIKVLVSQKDLVKALCDLTLPVKETLGLEKAQVCCGGVSLKEVDLDCGSKKAEGIYFAGEILDVDGMCGGYNLQWAWSSARAAGLAAGKGKNDPN